MVFIFWIFHYWIETPLNSEPTCNKKPLIKVANKQVWALDKGRAFMFQAGMSINADGSPRAYHPKNKGLDYNANGRYKGRWTSIVTINKKPYIQKKRDPAPGYYVSQTSLFNPKYKQQDPRRYVNAEKIPYIVLPKSMLTRKAGKASRARLGDMALVLNQKNGKKAFAIVADQGPSKHLGEGSIALAEALGVPASPKKGGIAQGLTYIVFPGSGDGLPKSARQIKRMGTSLMRKNNSVISSCLGIRSKN